MWRFKKAAATISGWDYPPLAFIYPGFKQVAQMRSGHGGKKERTSFVAWWWFQSKEPFTKKKKKEEKRALGNKLDLSTNAGLGIHQRHRLPIWACVSDGSPPGVAGSNLLSIEDPVLFFAFGFALS